MTPAQIFLRKGLLAKIHQSQHHKILKETGEWQSWLKDNYGVDSSSKLSIDELYNLLDVIHNGATPTIKGHRPKGYEVATENQLKMIKALWDERSRTNSDAGLREFIYKTTKVRPLRLEILSKADATKVINGLKKL